MTTETIVCPACAVSDVHIVESWRMPKKSRAAACQTCGLLFVHPQPSEETLNAYYAADGSWQAERQAKLEHAGTRTKGGAPDMLAALDRYFAASVPTPGSRVLDFGCGTGTWLNTFQDCGWETFGIEPSTSVAFVRHRRLDVVPRDGGFDLAIIYHVLEHLPRPLDTLKALSAAIRPGGHCLISVPRLDMLPTHRNRKYCLDSRHHVVAYTEACLRGLLARAGLSTVAALHELDSQLTKGAPIRLRLLARRSESPVMPPNPAAALRPVFDALADIQVSA